MIGTKSLISHKFEMRYKRRPTKRRRRSSRGGNGGNGINKLIYNPFANVSNMPKIPDGKCQMSTGLRLQSVSEYTNQAPDTMYFVLFPGLNNCVTTFGTTTGSEIIKQPFENHGQFVSEARGTLSVAGSVDDFTNKIDLNHEFTWLPGQKLNQWRLISCGMRLSLINNDENNDGWWEAIRIQHNHENSYYMYGSKEKGVNYANVAGAINVQTPRTVTLARPLIDKSNYSTTYDGPTREEFGVSIDNWISHPTYVSGMLKDIGNVQFNLRQHDNENDFVKVPAGSNTSNFIDPSTVDELNKSPIRTYTHGQFVRYNQEDNVPNNTVDDSYDIILVRVHGKTAPNTVVNGEERNYNSTRLLCHVISNQEVMYDEGQVLTRYHTKSQRASTAIAHPHTTSAAVAATSSITP